MPIRLQPMQSSWTLQLWLIFPTTFAKGWSKPTII